MADNEHLTAVLGQTFGVLDMQPDYDTLAINVVEEQVVAVVQDSGGMHDVAVEITDRKQDKPRALSPFRTEQLFIANGLLRADHGRLNIRGATVDPRQPKLVDVDIYSSPQAINLFHQQLGRTLGSDIFKMMRIAHAGVHPPGDWLDGASKGEIWVADLDHWLDAEGDVKPSDHPQSWLNTPPRITRRMIDKAGELVTKYGDGIHAPQDERAEEIDAYVDGLETLATFTHDMQQSILRVTHPKVSGDEARATITDIMRLRPEYVSGGADRRHYALYHMYQFEDLGIMTSVAKSPAERRQALRAISALYVAHIAHNLLAIERMQPSPEFTARQNKKRQERLGDLMIIATEEYTPTEVLLI